MPSLQELRPKIERDIRELCGSLDYTTRRAPLDENPLFPLTTMVRLLP